MSDEEAGKGKKPHKHDPRDYDHKTFYQSYGPGPKQGGPGNVPMEPPFPQSPTDYVNPDAAPPSNPMNPPNP